MGAGAAALLLGAQTARAQECEANDDCPKGFACTEAGASTCAAPACAPDDPDCEVPEDACKPETFKWCTPLPCEDDNECEAGMVCWKEMREVCSGGAEEKRVPCEPGMDCITPPQEEPTCTVETVSQCVPQYVPPCEESADCGEGFDCVELIAMSCSGSSGGATPSDGGDGDSGDGGDDASGDMAFAPPPEERPAPECTSEPTGEFHCQLQEIACELDGDCPSGFTCIDNPSIPVCDSARPAPADEAPPADGGEAGAAAPQPPADDEEKNDCGVDESLPVKVCSPPFADLGGIGFDGRAESGSATDDPSSAPTMGTNSGDAKGDSAGGEEPPSDSDDDGEDANENAAGSDDAASSSDSSGCSVSTGSSSGLQTFAWLALGLAVMRARRRTR